MELINLNDLATGPVPVRLPDDSSDVVICMLRRCGLCRFYLSPGDKVRIGKYPFNP